ncbi:MAG: hypothetical protein LBD79_04715 [Treponema sp.]|jgi:hypothetical protein|nr:hypothetical protein [Treponema sp.]
MIALTAALDTFRTMLKLDAASVILSSVSLSAIRFEPPPHAIRAVKLRFQPLIDTHLLRTTSTDHVDYTDFLYHNFS